jgi:DNA polymerase V
VFSLIDCNNFYASCEKLFDPALHTRPLVVLSNNDGCVIARCARAKARNIPMGMPFFKLRERIQQENIAVRSSNYELYGDMSRRVMNTLARCTPHMEIYSIDEAFLTFPDTASGLSDTGQAIRHRLFRETGIPVSVGTAPTKTLAKAANWYAKKHTKRGVCTLESAADISVLVEKLPVEEIWGIGSRHGRRLKERGIITAADFVRAFSPRSVQREMSITGLRTWRELQAIPAIPLEEEPPPKKSLAVTRSFGSMVTAKSDLAQALSRFTERAAEKLRHGSLAAQRMDIFILTNRHRKDLPDYTGHRGYTFPVPTTDTPEMVHTARRLLKEIYRRGFYYKKAGVILSGLTDDTHIQTSLFDPVNRTQSSRLMAACDTINRRYGKTTVHTAAAGGAQKASWTMRQNHLSFCPTTRWKDIITVRV